MRTGRVLAEVCSAAWESSAPTASVVVATHQRKAFLGELLDALERLDPPAGGFEVVLVDDGSLDGTWDELRRLAAGTPLALLALRLEATGGPSVPRNTAASRCRGRVLALTDDDCLPDRGWLRALCAGLAAGATVVQGPTRPGPGGPRGAWDRTISVSGVSGLYETCNLALPLDVFLRLGGFPVLASSGSAARGFGEDVLLGAAAAREGVVAWAAAAGVQHRWLSGTFRDHLAARRRLADFPLLVRQVPELRDRLWHHVFLTRRTATVDGALVGLGMAVAGHRRAGCLAVLPWLVLALRDARDRPGRPVAWRLGQLALADGVACLSLVQGAVRHRSVLL